MINFDILICRTKENPNYSATLKAGVDRDGELGLRYEFIDNNDSWDNDDIRAIIKSDDAKVLANTLDCSVERLAETIANQFKTTELFSTPTEVEKVFKRILAYIESNGTQYRMSYL
ncbi:MAG: hypothetical protein J6K74_01590 [Marinifilaceae bacterium]|nr:hypothetical protein [Marinifilaceae bacterium]